MRWLLLGLATLYCASACTVQDTDGDKWDLTALAGLSEALGPGPASCSRPACDWLYFFDVCNVVATYPPIPGRPDNPGCSSNVVTVAVRIEDELPTSFDSICQDMGAQGATTTYHKTEDGGLSVHFESSSSYALVLNLIRDCGAPVRTLADSGLWTGADRAADLFTAGQATLDWPTSGICYGGDLGWTIAMVIVFGGAAYVGAGVLYGRSKTPPAEGDGSWAHPEGLGAAAWHPHYQVWNDCSGLVREGGAYTMMRYAIWRNGGTYEKVDRQQGQHDGLLAESSMESSLEQSSPAAAKKGAKNKKSRRASAGEVDGGGKREEKKKKKRKPRPVGSLPSISVSGKGGIE